MKEWVKNTIVALGLSLVLSTPVYHVIANEQSTAPSILINGELQQYEMHPRIESGSTLVPMRAIFESLGSEVTWIEDTKSVLAKRDDVQVEVKIGSYFAKVNNNTLQLAVQPKIIEGYTMVPLRFISETFGATVHWDGDTRTVTIETSNNKELDNPINESKNNDSIEEKAVVLTMEEAQELALKNSYALKNIEVHVDRTEELRYQASNHVTHTRNSGDDALALGALLGLLNQDAQLEMARKQVELTEEGIAFQVRATFDDLIIKENEINISDMVIKNKEAQLKILRIKAENGTESQFNLTMEQSALKEEKLKKEKLLQELDDAYIKLNNLIGKKETDRYPIVHNVDLEWLKSINIDNHIQRLINDNPRVWLKEQEINIKQRAVDLYVYNSNSDPYRVKEIDVQTARYELASMKQDIDKDTRSRLNQMQQLETQYAILETNVAKAKQALELTRAQYDAGMAIDIQLEDAELALDQLESQKLSMAISYEQLKTLLYKPWLMG